MHSLNNKYKKILSTILLFITAAIWGISFVAQSEAMNYVGAFTFNGVSFALGGLVLIPIVLITDRFATDVKPIKFSIAQFLTCSLLSLIVAFAFEDVKMTSIIDGYGSILFNGLLYVGISHTLQTIGQRHVEPAKAAIIFSTDSLFAVIGGALLLGEVLTMRSYAGCGFIFIGIIISQINITAY